MNLGDFIYSAYILLLAVFTQTVYLPNPCPISYWSLFKYLFLGHIYLQFNYFTY